VAFFKIQCHIPEALHKSSQKGMTSLDDYSKLSKEENYIPQLGYNDIMIPTTSLMGYLLIFFFSRLSIRAEQMSLYCNNTHHSKLEVNKLPKQEGKHLALDGPRVIEFQLQRQICLRRYCWYLCGGNS
jgi:hypothetical protein